MSLFVLRFLRCDAILPGGEQCDSEVSTPIPQLTVEDLRAVLRESGWRRRAGRDYCPVCTSRLPVLSA